MISQVKLLARHKMDQIDIFTEPAERFHIWFSYCGVTGEARDDVVSRDITRTAIQARMQAYKARGLFFLRNDI